ncbi:MAG: DedA family protein [Rhodothermales bacterium]
MSDFLNSIVEWMEAIPAVWAYAVIFLIAYGENVIPPIPGDMIVVFGGYLVGIGKLSFAVVLILSVLGGALGFMTMYAVGRRLGDAVFEEDRLRWLPKEQIRKAQAWLGRWGYSVVAANRFLSGVRSVIALSVGMARMPVRVAALLSTISAALWCALIIFAGYALGENWRAIADYLARYGRIMVVVLSAVALGVIAWQYVKRNRQRVEREKPPQP